MRNEMEPLAEKRGAKRITLLYILLIGLFTIYHFAQHYNEPLDGDVADVILPSTTYAEVLTDPFGIGVLLEGKRYAGTNRYFAHQSLRVYLLTVPFGLQYFLDPIESVYVSVAIFKTLLELLLIGLLVLYITPLKLRRTSSMLLIGLLIFPLFQNSLYNSSIGIISISISYTFFYALPMAGLLFFFWPFYRAIEEPETLAVGLNLGTRAGLLVLLIVLPFSGPLISPLVFLVCPPALLFYFLFHLKKSNDPLSLAQCFQAIKAIPPTLLFYFSAITIVALYSFYIGTFNYENEKVISLAQRYAILPEGLFQHFSLKPAYLLLLLPIVINSLLLWKLEKALFKKALACSMLAVAIISVIYTLLLPLGGYRAYRPKIVAGDTFLPVNIGLFFLYGKSIVLVAINIAAKWKKKYIFGVIIISALFVLANEGNFGKNHCEKQALNQLRQSQSEITVLSSDCTILHWVKFDNTKATINNSRLLQIWNITDELKLYYQE